MTKTYNIAEFLNHLKINAGKNTSVFVINYDEYPNMRLKSEAVAVDFYMLAVKSNIESNVDYGQTFDDEGKAFLYMEKPNGKVEWDIRKPFSGYNLLISRKLFDKSALSSNFPDYGTHDALFLTSEEEILLWDIFEKAYAEFRKDKFSTEILVSYAKLILSYANVFYERQFETRKQLYNKIVTDFYQNLEAYYGNNNEFMTLPNVAYFAEKSNHSPNYFGDVIKHLKGNSPLEIIHEHIITIAKNKLRESDLTVNQIAYSLGFEYPTYFTRFFKKKTGITPTVFRNQ